MSKNITLYMGLIKKFDSFVSEKLVAEAQAAGKKAKM